MSDLIVVSFDREDTADQALNKLQALRKECVVELEDAEPVLGGATRKVLLGMTLPVLMSHGLLPCRRPNKTRASAGTAATAAAVTK